ncbi:MAG: hypothetical protein ACXWCY_18205 [Burkholderiales bacterium]
MQTVEVAVDALSRIPDATLLSAPPDQTVDAVYTALAPIRFEGIALRAPAIVTTRQHSAMPVFVAIAHSASRQAQVAPGDNAIVIVNRIHGPQPWIVPLFPPRPAKRPMPSTDFPPAAASGQAGTPLGSTTVQHVDLKAARDLPLEPGHYAIRVVSYDWRSNTVLVRVDDSEVRATQHEGAAREALRAKWAQAGRGTADTLPHFVKSAQSPALEGVGVAAAFPLARVPSTGALPIYGVVRLASASVRSDAPVAVEAGHVILTRRGILNPIVLTFGLPLYASGGGMIEAYFAYDLSKVSKAPLPPAEYAAYFIVQEHTAGPYTITIQ